MAWAAGASRETASPDALPDEVAVERRAERDRFRIKWLKDQAAWLQKHQPMGRRLTRGAAHGIMSATAATIAYLPAQPLGLREGFWGTITTLAVAQTEFGAARSVARDQFVGAGIGGVVGVCVSLANTPDLPSYAAAVIFSILTCWLVNVVSAARLSAITATIILLVPHTGTPQRMLASRVFEVGWGICAAIGTVWVVTRVNRRLGLWI